MTTVKKTLPHRSLINRIETGADYCDTISVFVASVKSVDERQTELSQITFPLLNFLMKLRDVLVKPFKLKRSDEFTSNFNSYYKVGERAGHFTVVNRNDSEILMGENDRHLHFFTSTICENTQNGQFVHVATSVFYNNRIGQVYFFFVKPFHRLLIKMLLRKIT